MPVVRRRRRSAITARTRARRKVRSTGTCARLERIYFRARAAVRRQRRDPKSAFVASEEATEAVLQAVDRRCAWVKRISKLPLD